VPAYKLTAGAVLDDGRIVAEARIFEARHEWLSVAVTFTDGSTETFDFYTRVPTTESEASNAGS
jgi:hypothetical protein